MKMDRPRLYNVIDIHSEISRALDSWRQESTGETWRRSVEREMKTLELEPSHEVGSAQKTLALFGCGLMCDPTQRGLSK